MKEAAMVAVAACSRGRGCGSGETVSRPTQHTVAHAQMAPYLLLTPNSTVCSGKTLPRFPSLLYKRREGA